MKDNFSSHADQYAKFRPVYPAEFYTYLRNLLPEKKNAWDCGTGNGQVAAELALFFEKVYASDISAQQLQHAIRKENIDYSIQPAEKTNFPDRFFDLILVAQAIHWFDFDAFYKEVHRVAKPGALFVVMGYGNLRIDPEMDAVITELYTTITGPYWDAERRYIDEKYSTIPFVGEELPVPAFTNEYNWTIDHLVGYLGTWSGVKHYQKARGTNPLELVREKLVLAWGDKEKRKVEFPFLLRMAVL